MRLTLLAINNEIGRFLAHADSNFYGKTARISARTCQTSLRKDFEFFSCNNRSDRGCDDNLSIHRS